MYTVYLKSCNWLHHTLGFKNNKNVAQVLGHSYQQSRRWHYVNIVQHCSAELSFSSSAGDLAECMLKVQSTPTPQLGGRNGAQDALRH